MEDAQHVHHEDASAVCAVTNCPHCGATHHGRFVHRGHQGRGTYVFCPVTGKPVVLAPAAPG